MSSKSQDEKDGQEGKNEDLDILDLVQKYCISNDFESAFESFAEDNYEIFKDALDFKVHGQEHPREYHEVYLKYIAKFEGLIEDFIVKVLILFFTLSVISLSICSPALCCAGWVVAIEWIHIEEVL